MKDVDPTDAGILYLLRNDARNTTTAEIGDALDLSSSTVGTRINELEERGVIEGYEPRIDFDELGYEHQFVIAGTTPFESRRDVAAELTDVATVVDVRSMMTTDVNVAAKIVTDTRASVEMSLEELQRRGLSIDRIEILETEHRRPANVFAEFVTGASR